MTVTRIYLPGLLAAALVLTACGGVHTTRPVEQEFGGAEIPEQVDLPGVVLTQDVLFDVLLGEIAGRQGEFDISVHVMSRAAQKTRDPRLAQRATLTALYIKRYAEALTSARLWVQIQPDNIEANQSLATALLGLNDPVEAQLYFQKSLALGQQAGKLGQTFLHVASVLGQQSNRTTAFEVMQSLVASYPEDPSAHFALAHLAIRADESKQALAAINEALRLRQGWEEAALFKVRILVSLKDAQAALDYFQEFVDRYPRATKVRLNYARYLVDLKRWEEARRQFVRVVKDSPDDADAVMAAGLLALQVNRLEEADTYLKHYLHLNPDNDQARLYLGQVADQRKDYDQAIRWYGEITDDNYYFDAQTHMAIAIARQGNVAAARKRLQQVKPGNEQQQVQLLLTEEQLLREQKDYQEALQVLNSGLAMVPGNKDILYARALIAEKLDKLDQLERDLRTILKSDPDNVNALNALGYTLADRTDRLQEAKKLLTRALELKPDDAFVLDSMGWLQYRQGNHSEAIRYLRKALSIRDDAEISAHLGEVLWMTGDRSEAKSVWRRALRITPDNETLRGIVKKFDQ